MQSASEVGGLTILALEERPTSCVLPAACGDFEIADAGGREGAANGEKGEDG